MLNLLSEQLCSQARFGQRGKRSSARITLNVASFLKAQTFPMFVSLNSNDVSLSLAWTVKCVDCDVCSTFVVLCGGCTLSLSELFYLTWPEICLRRRLCLKVVIQFGSRTALCAVIFFPPEICFLNIFRQIYHHHFFK